MRLRWNTYHIPSQISLLHPLEPPQVLQHALTCISHIVLGNIDRLLQLAQRLFGLAKRVASRTLRVCVSCSLYGVGQTTKDLRCDAGAVGALMLG